MAKPFSMGGAYTAIEDGIISAAYNPAALSYYQQKKDHRFTFYLNPIAPISYYNYQNDVKSIVSEKFISRDYLKTALLMIKSIGFSSKFFDLAFIFNEQIIDRQSLSTNEKFIYNHNLWDNCYHTAALRLKLDERVSIGVSGNLYNYKENNKTEMANGFSYGILIKPASNLNVGVAYVDFQKEVQNIRLPLERMIDETMNVGIAYQPTRTTTFTYDIRNLTEDKKSSVRESHFGFEQQFFSILAIRLGYYQEKQENNRIYSCGVGLIDSNLLFSKENKFRYGQFLLNYAFNYQDDKESFARWHTLSLLLRF